MLHIQYFALLCYLSSSLSLASPVRNGAGSEPRSSSSLPILTLPYASYRASSYSSDTDIYIFKNIRYAAPPVGDLRWAKPAPPLKNATLQDGSYGHACVQSAINGLNFLGPENGSPVGAAVNQFLGGIPVPLFSGGDEDCLFLDLYVPGKALRNPSSSKLPVLVFIYGGGYVFGSKDSLQPELPFYDGSGMIGRAGGDMIYVAMNYRLGAYGFLAGTTMEKEGLPNAGLWDQRAAFQWVRDHIGLVGGDPARVTAMGESAGAGSIMHHLVAQGGALDPLFSRAIVQSPAFQLIFDRAGTVEATFQGFASLAGCAGRGVECLRGAPAAALARANTRLMAAAPPGTFAVGPTPDGAFVRQLPALELAAGRMSPGVESLLLSHCAQESSLFVSGLVATDAEFDAFLDAVFPNYTREGDGDSISARIAAFYPPTTATKNKTYATESARMEAFLRDSCFTCNVRYLTEAVGDARAWNMQYSVTPGWHATDLLPTFFDARLTADSALEDLGAALLAPVAGALLAGVGAAMQSYFASYATTGDPNTRRAIWNLPSAIQWDHPDSDSNGSEQIAGVLDVGDLGLRLVSDDQNERAPCAFWRDVAAAVTALGGYAPPGEETAQGLVAVSGDPSANYVGGNS